MIQWNVIWIRQEMLRQRIWSISILSVGNAGLKFDETFLCFFIIRDTSFVFIIIHLLKKEVITWRAMDIFLYSNMYPVDIFLLNNLQRQAYKYWLRIFCLFPGKSLWSNSWIILNMLPFFKIDIICNFLPSYSAELQKPFVSRNMVPDCIWKYQYRRQNSDMTFTCLIKVVQKSIHWFISLIFKQGFSICFIFTN